MAAVCPACGGPVDLGGSCARCASSALERAADAWIAERESATPAGLAYAERDEAGTRVLSIAPPRAAALPIAGFALVWDAFLVVWYATATRSSSVIMLVFPLIHVWAGVQVTRDALRRLFNHATIRVDAERVVYREGPVPAGRVEMALEAIASVEVESGARRVRFGASRTESFSLRVVARDGTGAALALELPSYEQASFVARRLERAIDEARRPKGYRR